MHLIISANVALRYPQVGFVRFVVSSDVFCHPCFSPEVIPAPFGVLDGSPGVLSRAWMLWKRDVGYEECICIQWKEHKVRSGAATWLVVLYCAVSSIADDHPSFTLCGSPVFLLSDGSAG